jgi:hypothetical protein
MHLKSNTALSEKTHKLLGVKDAEPRIREANEALPITFTVSQLISIPKMEPSRPGANDHLAIGRRGVFC